jgi:hypothetical protein
MCGEEKHELRTNVEQLMDAVGAPANAQVDFSIRISNSGKLNLASISKKELITMRLHVQQLAIRHPHAFSSGVLNALTRQLIRHRMIHLWRKIN